MYKIKARLKELFPKRKDRAEFLGVDPNDYDKKVKTFENKINWLKANLKQLGLTVKIVKDEKES